MRLSLTLEREYGFVVKRPGAFARLPAVLACLGTPEATVRRRALTDTYLDTDDLLLAKAGAGCRVRVSGESAEATLKSLAPADDGLAVRNEWSEPLRRTAVGLWLRGLPRGGALAARLHPLLRGARLRVLFRLRQDRTVYRVRTRDGSLIQVSADSVRWGGNRPRPALLEIEIELLGGSVESLRRVAAKLKKKLDLRPAKESKYAYGLRLAGLSRPGPPERRPRGPRARRIGEALRAVIEAQTARLLWHRPGATLGLNSEPVHDMRVAIRRLRAALRVFDKALPPDLAGPLEAGLKRLAAALGVVRDLDVHAERVARDAASLEVADNPAVVEYLRRLDRGRGEAQRRLARELNSARFASVARRLDEAAARLPPPGGRPQGPAATNVAQALALVRPFFLKVRRDGGRVRPNSPDASFHRLRIRCKRLRYACEFLRPAIGANARTYAARLARLQEVLGRHHDSVMAAGTIRRFLATPAARRRPGKWSALRRLAAHLTRQSRAERREFFGAWKHFDRKRIHGLLFAR